MNFKEVYDGYKLAVEKEIDDYLRTLDCHKQLYNAIEYSLKAGGKRIRPIMFLACLDMLGVNSSDYLKLAISIEFIHTYSLIHDDLPALDNDDFRRGKPSNHAVFGEGVALLAGDALLNCAIELALFSIKGRNELEAVRYLFRASGACGMLDGQIYDIYYQNKEIDNKEKILSTIDELKTGKLLTAPLVMASLIANKKYLSELTEIGRLTGKLFQFCDDLLDVAGSFDNLGKTVNKDASTGKLTAISVYGIENTKNIINDTYNDIIKILKNIDNNGFFIDFYDFIKSREH